jgi:hypothetical protein
MNFEKIRFGRLINLFFWVIAVALLINVARIVVPRLKVHALDLTSQATPSHSYTSILRETLYDSQGHAQPSIATYTWAVRADGSRIGRSEILDGPMTKQRNISFASGEVVSINELAHMKSTTTYRDVNPDSWIRDPRSNCLNSMNGQRMMDGEELSGNESVNGYQAVRIAVKTPAKDTLTSWFAPNYGCAIVKFEANWEGGARTEQDLVTLLSGEPSPALFSVPADYAEVAPSKMLPSSISSDTAQRLDQKYYAHHAQ